MHVGNGFITINIPLPPRNPFTSSTPGLMQGLLASTRARTVPALPPLFRRAMSSPTPQAPAAEASSSRARSPVRVPGPVETTMQSKVSEGRGAYGTARDRMGSEGREDEGARGRGSRGSEGVREARGELGRDGARK